MKVTVARDVKAPLLWAKKPFQFYRDGFMKAEAVCVSTARFTYAL